MTGSASAAYAYLYEVPSPRGAYRSTVAKAKKTPQENPTAKPKRRIAAYKRKRAARANPAPRANPAFASDVTHLILPGFAAYGGVRVLQRIVYQIVQKRWPKWGKWAHAATGLGAAGALWGFAHRIKALAGYHDAIVMGSSVAAVQGVANAILPVKYNWLLSDCRPEDVKSVAPAQPQIAQMQTEAPSADNDEYSYLEEQLGALSGGPARSVAAPRRTGKPVSTNLNLATQGQAPAVTDPDLMSELGDEDLDDLYSGAFEMN